MSPTAQEIEKSAICICGSGKKFVQCCRPFLKSKDLMNPTGDALTNPVKSNYLKGYQIHLTDETTRYAAQLYTSNDLSEVHIASLISPSGKFFEDLIAVPDPKAARWVDTVVMTGGKHEGSEAATEALVYALYKQVCARRLVKKNIPDCLKNMANKGCTRERYAVHFGHVRERVEHEAMDGVDYYVGTVPAEAPGAETREVV